MSSIEDSTVEISGKRIGIDDFIQVLPTPGKRDGFIGRCRGWWITDDGEITAIDVWGGKAGHQMMRSIRPNRIRVLSPRRQATVRAAAGRPLRNADLEAYPGWQL